jgi:hypothetical protein
MPKWYEYGLGFGNPAFKSGRKRWGQAASNFFGGQDEERENISTLLPGQEPLLNQALEAGTKGPGGAFGTAADYYRDLLSDNPADLQAFTNPAMRQYNEEIVPGISEQFAGMGSGGLSSSGFRNAQVQGGVDLAERLGQIRANLRQAGAQGLTNIGQIGLGNFSQPTTTQEGSEGFLSQLAPAAGSIIGSIIGGPAGGAAGYQAGNMFSGANANSGSWFNGKGNKVGASSHPYGSTGYQASPKITSPKMQPQNMMQQNMMQQRG